MIMLRVLVVQTIYYYIILKTLFRGDVRVAEGVCRMRTSLPGHMRGETLQRLHRQRVF